MAPITRGKIKQIQENFPQFMEMPKEVRLMVWKEAMPSYGILHLICNHRSIFSSRPFSIGVDLPHTNDRGPAFSARLQTTRALLSTCRESRVELQYHFPHSIPSSGAELLFHGVKDTIFLKDPDEYFTESLQIVMTSDQRDLSIFEDSWNLVVQKLAIQSWSLEVWLRDLSSFRYVTTSEAQADVHDFQTFLVSNFPKLRQLFFTTELDVSMMKWKKSGKYRREHLNTILEKCYTSGANWTDERPRRTGFRDNEIRTLTLAVDNFNRVLHGNPEARENMLWKEIMQSSLPQLQHVEVFPMVHVHAKLEDLCQEVPTD